MYYRGLCIFPDSAWIDEPCRDYTEHNFGLVHEDYSPKPSLLAIAAMTRIIGNGIFVKDLSRNPDKYRLYLFDMKGKPVIAAWAVQGKRNVKLEINEKSVDLVDLMGNVQSLSIHDKQMNVVLTEIPVYLRGEAIDQVKVQNLKP